MVTKLIYGIIDTMKESTLEETTNVYLNLENYSYEKTNNYSNMVYSNYDYTNMVL